MTSTNKAKVDEELKKLALAYIHATNAGDSSLAENILHNIEELRKIYSNH